MHDEDLPTKDDMHPVIRARVEHDIKQYGLSVIGVSGDPPFNYTIGLLEKFGFELINVGLSGKNAVVIFNDIHEALKNGFVIEDGKLSHDFTNLPVMFKQVKDSHLIWDEYAVQAFAWWGKKFPIFQMVLSDRAGLLPHQEGFDREYMSPRQKLFY